MTLVPAFIRMPQPYGSVKGAYRDIEVQVGVPMQILEASDVRQVVSSHPRGIDVEGEVDSRLQPFVFTVESFEEVTVPVGEEVYEVEGENGLEDEYYTVYENELERYTSDYVVFCSVS